MCQYRAAPFSELFTSRGRYNSSCYLFSSVQRKPIHAVMSPSALGVPGDLPACVFKENLQQGLGAVLQDSASIGDDSAFDTFVHVGELH